MVSNHVVDLLKRYDQSLLPASLTGYLERREFYDYSEHSRTGAKHGEFVDDETCDRFCILGTVEDHIAKLRDARGARRQAVQHVPHDRAHRRSTSAPTASTSSPCFEAGRPSMEIACQPQRAIADLRALAELTGGPGGARRLCWTDEWASARAPPARAAGELPVDVEVDEAGNLWARLAGDAARDGRDRLAHRLGAERRLARRRARRDGGARDAARDRGGRARRRAP